MLESAFLLKHALDEVARSVNSRLIPMWVYGYLDITDVQSNDELSNFWRLNYRNGRRVETRIPSVNINPPYATWNSNSYTYPSMIISLPANYWVHVPEGEAVQCVVSWVRAFLEDLLYISPLDPVEFDSHESLMRVACTVHMNRAESFICGLASSSRIGRTEERAVRVAVGIVRRCTAVEDSDEGTDTDPPL
jgi:hypothetical protein